MEELIWQQVLRIRSQAPLVCCITNEVAAPFNANALLAAGASPVMSCETGEADELAARADAVVINIGTADHRLLEVMTAVLRAAAAYHKPVVLDPVGAGATTFRTRAVQLLLAAAAPACIRGNASEIMAVAGLDGATRGVDSVRTSDEALHAAQMLAGRTGCTVSVSGASDLICSDRRTGRAGNGHPLMARVSGMGCTASALLGAFAAVEADPFLAATGAAAFMGVCGETAAARASGPGTFPALLLDTMYHLSESTFKSACRVTVCYANGPDTTLTI